MSDETSSLETLMRPALDGDRGAIEAFLRALLNESLFVPEREQAQKMSDTPVYPDPFLNILGVQDRERVVVPVFSRRQLIFEWCGNDLRHRTIRGAELLKIMPTDWWLCINPAADVEKELSPWEIEQLRAGEQGIPAIVEEIFQQQAVEPLEVQTVRSDDYPQLVAEAKAFAENTPAIRRMFLVRHVGRDVEGNTLHKLFLGAEVARDEKSQSTELQHQLQAIADRCQVGSDHVSVSVSGTETQDLTFGFFANSAPFYTAAPAGSSFLRRLTSKFSGR